MPALKVQVTRFVDPDPQPGMSECRFTDAHGTVWTLVDKYLYMSARWLHERLSYPRPGSLECTEISRLRDDRGREIVRINLRHVEVQRADGSADDPVTSVEVLSEQVLPCRKLSVRVTDFADATKDREFPLFSCEFADAKGKNWRFTDNKWILAPEHRRPGISFPQLGHLHCLEVSRRRDNSGREIVLIDTEAPLGAEDGRLPEQPDDAPTQFEVAAELLTEVPESPPEGV
jgi:hypothetical protein